MNTCRPSGALIAEGIIGETCELIMQMDMLIKKAETFGLNKRERAQLKEIIYAIPDFVMPDHEPPTT